MYIAEANFQVERDARLRVRLKSGELDAAMQAYVVLFKTRRFETHASGKEKKSWIHRGRLRFPMDDTALEAERYEIYSESADEEWEGGFFPERKHSCDSAFEAVQFMDDIHTAARLAVSAFFRDDHPIYGFPLYRVPGMAYIAPYTVLELGNEE